MASSLKPRLGNPSPSSGGSHNPQNQSVISQLMNKKAAPPPRLAQGNRIDDEKEGKILDRKNANTQMKHLAYFFSFLAVCVWAMSSRNPYGKDRRRHRHVEKKSTLLRNPKDILAFTANEDEAAAADNEEVLKQKVKELDLKVRHRQQQPGIMMEKDPTGLALTKQLQDYTRKLIVAKYGSKQFRVKIDLEYPKTLPDFTYDSKDASFVVELANIEWIPCSVYYFLEIVRTFDRTGIRAQQKPSLSSFHRNAGHVLQAQVVSFIHKSMPFQEYSPRHPHEKFTMGYAGRPSGPGFYISIQNNTLNHGPGSQQDHNPYEADSNFGHLVTGMDDVIPRMHTIPQKGWLDNDHVIRITNMTILVPSGGGGDNDNNWTPWIPKPTLAPKPLVRKANSNNNNNNEEES